MSRYQSIDALRGLAILFIVVFHFCFDLAYFGFTGWDFYNDPFWLHARTLILGTFLLLVGMSLVLAVSLLLLGNYYHSAWFDQWNWRWFGLMTHKPATEDYVPLLPWFGVVLCGIVLGHAWRRLPALSTVKSLRGGPALRVLAAAGRHSLVIYLLHQPVLMALLWLVVRINELRPD